MASLTVGERICRVPPPKALIVAVPVPVNESAICPLPAMAIPVSPLSKLIVPAPLLPVMVPPLSVTLLEPKNSMVPISALTFVDSVSEPPDSSINVRAEALAPVTIGSPPELT
jgi:hypothetical protein